MTEALGAGQEAGFQGPSGDSALRAVREELGGGGHDKMASE